MVVRTLPVSSHANGAKSLLPVNLTNTAMTWIRTIPLDKAAGKLGDLYRRIKGPQNAVDNIMIAHSLRPHTMEGHLALYKATLHHSANTLPVWFLEALGLYVSVLNRCSYCIEHHYEGLRRRLRDDDRAQAILAAFNRHNPQEAFAGGDLTAMEYAEALTQNPYDITKKHIIALREAGFDDGQVLEINQVVSYFAYANRTVLGLGVTTEEDVLGLSPSSDDSADLSHR